MPALTPRSIALDLPRARPAELFAALLRAAGSEQGSLLEKTEGGRKTGFAAAAPFEILRVRGGKARSWYGGKERVLRGNPFSALGARLREFKARTPEPFSSGAMGWLSYETVGCLEKLPLPPREGDDAALMLFDTWLVFNERGARLVTARRDAAALARRLKAELKPSPLALPEKGPPVFLAGTLGKAAFLEGVRALKKHIRAGDIFQAVLSEKFRAPCAAAPERFYDVLTAIEPSPYQFLFKDRDAALVGASPERLVMAAGGTALNCPIAGTRRRGKTAAEDARLERALKRSPKERAEHLMLVDLARNDLGRVCEPGSVKVAQLMKVRRFSEVMHLVSEVEGRCARPAWDVLAASFPAGTVSGAPKIRAMELLAGLEPQPRGFYAGAFLQHDFSGNLDSAITIRSAWLTPGHAVIQAGAGVVADSNPEREYQEVVNKLAGLRRALSLCEA